MQYTEIFKVVKKIFFCRKCLLFFLIFAQNIDCGYTLQPPRRGGSNEYGHTLYFEAKIRKIGVPLHTSVFNFCYIKVGFEGVHISWFNL